MYILHLGFFKIVYDASKIQLNKQSTTLLLDGYCFSMPILLYGGVYWNVIYFTTFLVNKNRFYRPRQFYALHDLYHTTYNLASAAPHTAISSVVETSYEGEDAFVRYILAKKQLM